MCFLIGQRDLKEWLSTSVIMVATGINVCFKVITNQTLSTSVIMVATGINTCNTMYIKQVSKRLLLNMWKKNIRIWICLNILFNVPRYTSRSIYYKIWWVCSYARMLAWNLVADWTCQLGMSWSRKLRRRGKCVLFVIYRRSILRTFYL